MCEKMIEIYLAMGAFTSVLHVLVDIDDVVAACDAQGCAPCVRSHATGAACAGHRHHQLSNNIININLCPAEQTCNTLTHPQQYHTNTMAFVTSTLTPHLSVRMINPAKGRGLFAEKDFEPEEVVLLDKSLIAMV